MIHLYTCYNANNLLYWENTDSTYLSVCIYHVKNKQTKTLSWGQILTNVNWHFSIGAYIY